MSGLAALLVGRREPGVYRWESHLPAGDVAHAVAHAGWRAFVLDGRTVTEAADLHTAIAAACQLPDWYGRNWDALADCLADLSWAPARGWILLYEGWGMLARTDPDAWQAVRGVLLDTCRYWRGSTTPFAVLLRGPGPTDGIPELR
ncbi:MAG: barstar family protein [Sporichthyaceae bacterium]|nr:barstar family protein [Sporichthyaceae bacterium]